MKTVIPLTLILLLTTFQTASATQERYDPRNPGDMRERRPAEDMRERRPAEDMRERRPVEDMRERRPAGDMGERRPATDMRERRDSSSQRSTDRPWRETLAKCREMKKAGKLSKAMKEECKAARELRKKNKQ